MLEQLPFHSCHRKHGVLLSCRARDQTHQSELGTRSSIAMYDCGEGLYDDTSTPTWFSKNGWVRIDCTYSLPAALLSSSEIKTWPLIIFSELLCCIFARYSSKPLAEELLSKALAFRARLPQKRFSMRFINLPRILGRWEDWDEGESGSVGSKSILFGRLLRKLLTRLPFTALPDKKPRKSTTPRFFPSVESTRRCDSSVAAVANRVPSAKYMDRR